jgi:hypothetical protein
MLPKWWILPVVVLATPLRADEAFRVFVVDLHSHARSGPFVRDDGKEKLDEQADRFGRAGFHAVFHTPHSDLTKDPELWKRQREHERRGQWPLDRFLGEEVTVEKGPLWAVILGRRNNDHLGVVGQDEWITHALPVKAVCEWAHAMGATVTVNHPGPGPSMWEAGYWHRPGLRDRIDAIEVCNGRIMHALPLDFFALYLQAVTYRGWGLKVAAVGGTDTHSASEVPEVGTFVVARTLSERSVADAIRNCRTFVAYRLLDLRLRCPQLGRTIRSGDVSLSLTCSRRVQRIDLLREGKEAKHWTDTDRAEFDEVVSRNTAYAWRVLDGEGRVFSSAIWYEPKPPRRPDLAVDVPSCTLRDRTLKVVVRNKGDAPARNVVVEAWASFPWAKGVLLAGATLAEVGAASVQPVVLRLKENAESVFIRVDPDSYALDRNDDRIEELDERNNCALLPAQQAHR